MKPSREERINRWIDGELADDDVRDLLEADPGLRAAKAETERLGVLLRSDLEAEATLPHADFFNRQILRRIQSRPGEKITGWRDEFALFPWFTRFRVISAFGFSAALIGLIAFGLGSPPADRSEVVMTYTPVPGTVATAEYHRGAEATVIRIAGVAGMPE